MTARILVVEDEAQIRNLLVEALTDEGYELECAENGLEGLEKIGSYKPELILCDVSMPKMSGFDLLTQFRQTYADQASTPFIFLTAFGDRKAQIEARELGVDDFLTKPVDFELLSVAIRNHLEKRENADNRHNSDLVKLYQKLSAESGVAANQVISGGRVIMLGLCEVRDQIGAAWGSVAKRVIGMAENVISQHLPEGCTYVTQGDDGFAICFNKMDESEAAGVIDTMKRSIRDTVNGAQARGEFAGMVAESSALDGVGAIRTEVHAVKVSKAQVEGAGDLISVVAGGLQEAVEDLAKSSADMLRDLLETATASPRPVQSIHGRPAPFVMLDIDPENHRRPQKIRYSLCDEEKIM